MRGPEACRAPVARTLTRCANPVPRGIPKAQLNAPALVALTPTLMAWDSHDGLPLLDSGPALAKPVSRLGVSAFPLANFPPLLANFLSVFATVQRYFSRMQCYLAKHGAYFAKPQR